jgi:predicted DNA-binding transcriptional regulator AlpA
MHCALHQRNSVTSSISRPCCSHLMGHQADRPDRILPRSLPPRGLSREQAAAYVGISPSLFDTLVKDGRMPVPKRINSRTVWDRLELDEAFTALPSNDVAVNPWDAITA